MAARGAADITGIIAFAHGGDHCLGPYLHQLLAWRALPYTVVYPAPWCCRHLVRPGFMACARLLLAQPVSQLRLTLVRHPMHDPASALRHCNARIQRGSGDAHHLHRSALQARLASQQCGACAAWQQPAAWLAQATRCERRHAVAASTSGSCAFGQGVSVKRADHGNVACVRRQCIAASLPGCQTAPLSSWPSGWASPAAGWQAWWVSQPCHMLPSDMQSHAAT